MSDKESKEKRKRLANRCPVCRKGHTGECLRGTDRCFACGKKGHQRKQCNASMESCSQAEEMKREIPCKKCGQRHREDYEGREERNVFYVCKFFFCIP